VSDDQDKPHVTQSSNSDAPPTAYFRVYSKPPGPGEPGYSEDVRRDVKDAIEQLKAKLPGEEFANLAKMAQQPSPLMKSAEGVLSGIGRSMSTPMHPRDRRFYLAVAFATVAFGFALTCLIAGASKQLDWIWAICGIVAGLLLVVLATLDALEKRVPFVGNTAPITIAIAAVTWLLIGWQTWVSFSHGPTQAQQDAAVSEAKSAVQSKLNEAIKQRDESSNELASARRDLTIARQELDAARKSANTLVQSVRSDTLGPINWNLNNQLIVASGGGQTAAVHGLIFQGQSLIPLRFKDAYAISGLTGHRVELKANVQQVGAYFPVTDVDVPADAPVQLDIVFQPPLSIRDFFDQWGKFRIVISYENGGSFEHEFDDRFVREKVQQMLPNSFGPRVTPRQTSK
jgi:hypothetical protein